MATSRTGSKDRRIMILVTALVVTLTACGSTDPQSTGSTITVPVASATNEAGAGGFSDTTQASAVAPAPATTSPTTTTVPLPRTTAEATPEDPVPPGEVVEFTGVWDVAVTHVDFDATEYVVSLNQINPVPEDGYQYVLISLVGTYLGERVAEPVFEWAVSDGVESFEPSIPGCGVIPDSIYDVVEVIPGESFHGSICVPVSSTSVEAGGLELFLQLPDDEPKFFSLQ